MASCLGGITCWLLDTRPLWPGESIEQAAPSLLALLPVDEQCIVKKKVFIADAKLSLASALLKRTYVSRALGIPWSEVSYTRTGDQTHGKPAARSPHDSSAASGIDFNISHQAGLVALIGWCADPAPDPSIHKSVKDRDPMARDLAVGVDIVCVHENNDNALIDTDGFDEWIDMYEAVFSDAERMIMKTTVDQLTLPDGRRVSGHEMGDAERCVRRNQSLSITVSTGVDEHEQERVALDSNLLIDAKLRRFYAFFAYKEAYVKLHGEALLAPWLTSLEFCKVKSPNAHHEVEGGLHRGRWGERVGNVSVTLAGKLLRDVRLDIRAFEESYMIATAIKGSGVLPEVPGFTLLNLECDILRFTR